MNQSFTITDNTVESIRINYDEERYALVHTDKAKSVTKTIILNEREAFEVAGFIEVAKEMK